MAYNKEDYLIAITLDFLNKLSVNPPLPVDYYNENNEDTSMSKAAFIINDTIMLVKITECDGKMVTLINIIFPNRESVALNLYEQGEVSISYDEQESRRFNPRPGVLRTIDLLLELVNQ